MKQSERGERRTSVPDFLVLELCDDDAPHHAVGLTVELHGLVIDVSNTTESVLRVVIAGEEYTLGPSPRRRECAVDGIVLSRWWGGVDVRAMPGTECVEPVELDALCAELLLPGGMPSRH